MTAEERIEQLEEQVRALQEQLAAAHQRIEELEKCKPAAPAFVKANMTKPPGQKKARKKRAAQFNQARPREGWSIISAPVRSVGVGWVG